MKKNLPVTNNAVQFPEGKYIVSKTDTKGIITYINDVFVDISGFSEQELLGKSHNVVRHPDMPEAAFQYLWDTLKSGRPWVGIVKNRCKSGDYYWVKAAVTPITDDETKAVTGYMSVRTQPSRVEIAEAEALYARINAGEKISFKPSWLKRLGVRIKLSAMFFSILGLLIGGALMGIGGQYVSNQRLEVAYSKHMESAVAFSRMVDRLSDNRAQIMLALQHSPDNKYSKMHDHSVDLHIENTLKNRELIESLRKVYEATEKSAEEQRLSNAFFEARDRFSREGVNAARELIKSGDFDKAQTLLLTKINPLHTELSDKARVLQDFLSQEGKQSLSAGETQFNLMFWASIVGTIVSTAFILLGGWFLVQALVRDFEAVNAVAQNVANGNLRARIDIDRYDEFGHTQCALFVMQTNLLSMADEFKSISAEVTKGAEIIRQEVDKVERQTVLQQESATSVAAATEQVAQSINQVASSSKHSVAVLEDTRSEMLSVSQDMQKSMEATQRVENSMKQTSVTMSTLTESVGKIQGISSAIRDIADQTNLLALNAAIEAARAGEQGRGFAVVADEVRKLAERTALSTKDITETIDDVRKVMNAAMSNMEVATTNVHEGVELIHASGDRLIRLANSNGDVVSLSTDIANATVEQATASESMAHEMDKVVTLSGESHSAAQQVRAMTESLFASASTLNKVIGRFKI